MGTKWNVQGIVWQRDRTFYMSPDRRLYIDRVGRRDYELSILTGKSQTMKLFRGSTSQCIRAAEYFEITLNSPTEEG